MKNTINVSSPTRRVGMFIETMFVRNGATPAGVECHFVL